MLSANCVTLEKLLNLSELWFLHHYERYYNKSANPIGLLGSLEEKML